MGLDPASAYDGCARLSTLDGWRRAAAVHGAWQQLALRGVTTTVA